MGPRGAPRATGTARAAPPVLDAHRIGPADFEDLYREEYRAVVGLAFALSGSRAGAEALAQEAFLAAYRTWRQVGCLERPGACVRRVVAR